MPILTETKWEVHLPLSELSSQKEAEKLMLPSKNLLKPADLFPQYPFPPRKWLSVVITLPG